MLIFFSLAIDNKKLFSQENEKWKNKSKKLLPIKWEKLQKDPASIYRNCSEDEEITKRNYAKTKTKNVSDTEIEKEKKEYMKNYLKNVWKMFEIFEIYEKYFP